jgi:hypothetical protein
VKLAMAQPDLVRAGDHVRVAYGKPNSWADGVHVLTGEDAIDFDITLAALNVSGQEATVVVRHLPPEKPGLEFPAQWMRAPVIDNTANNWLQVSKSDAKFAAAVGMETFDVQSKISLVDGRILSAAMDNPVAVVERECADRALTECGAPRRYQIRREVRIELQR